MSISLVYTDNKASTGTQTVRSPAWGIANGAVWIVLQHAAADFLSGSALAVLTDQGFARIIASGGVATNKIEVFVRYGVPTGVDTDWNIPDTGDHTIASLFQLESSSGLPLNTVAASAPDQLNLGASGTHIFSLAPWITVSNSTFIYGIINNADVATTTAYSNPLPGNASFIDLLINFNSDVGIGGGIMALIGSKSSTGSWNSNPPRVDYSLGVSHNAVPFYLEIVEVPPPTITSANAASNLIGTTLAHTLTANQSVAWSVAGGADAADFETSGSTLRFAGNAASSALGAKVVTVRATATSGGATVDQTITVTTKAIVLVGGKTWSRAGATGTVNVSLTDLTGGIATAPANGDYVIVMQGIGSNADRDVVTTTGYAELADIYANGTTYDANLGVFSKFMTSTPDTTVTMGSSGSANDAQAARIMVFRGVDPTTPLDVAVVTATGTGTGKPDPGSITPVTQGAVGVFSGAQAAATAVALTSSDLASFDQVIRADTNDIAVGGGLIDWSGSGAINPAAFGGGSNVSANSWAAVSLVLRPAYTGGGPAPIVGSLARTLPAITSSATGRLGIKGSTARTLPAITSSAVGKVALKGSTARTLPAITSSSSGRLEVKGALAQTLPAFTLAAGGRFGVNGTLTATIPPITSSAVGKLAIKATLARTLAAVTSSGVGKLAIKSNLAKTLGAIVATATGRVAIRGSSSATIAPISATATGRVAIRGVVASTLGPISSTSSGKLAIKGAVGVNLGAVTALSYGTSRHIGTVAATLGPITSSSAGKLAIKAAVARSIGAVTVTAVGGVAIPGAITGALIHTIPPVTSSSSGRLAIRGSLVRTLPAITASSAGQHRAAASLAVTIGSVTSTSSGRLGIRAVVARTIGPIVSAATGKLGVRGAVGATLAPVSSAAHGALAIVGSLARSIGDLVLTGRGRIGEAPPIPPERIASASPLGTRIASAPAIKDIDRRASPAGGSRIESTPALGSRYASASPGGDREA